MNSRVCPGTLLQALRLFLMLVVPVISVGTCVSLFAQEDENTPTVRLDIPDDPAPNNAGGQNPGEQNPGGKNADDQNAGGSGPAATGSSNQLRGASLTGNKYPQPPYPFVRGNPISQSGGRGGSKVGPYIPIVPGMFYLGLFFLFIKTTYWADSDSKLLKLNGEFWNSIIFLAGVAGFFLVFLVPNPYLGTFVLLASLAGPLGTYIFERNKHVPESGKVMTPAHIQKVVIRTLARMGIHVAPNKQARDKALGPPIRFMGKQSGGKGDDDNLARQAEKSTQYLSAKELIYDAIMQRATDVHLEPKPDEVAARYRIDGVMFPAEPFDRGVGDAIINIFKVLSAMDITEKRKPQDGSFRAELEDRIIDFRVASQGTRDGEKMSIRILDQSNSVSRMAGLGMRKQMVDQIKEVINSPHGMFLACGPTGAGKSTTLYAILNELDAAQINIITIEDPVEYKMSGVTQIEINQKAGQTFGGSLRSVLRQDPDVVMIGEIRDDETARIGCQAANTGHMVFSTVHANDTISALFRLIDLGVEPFLLSSALSAILGQRLCRKLCDDCKEAYKPKAELLKSLGLPPEKVEAFYRPPEKRATTCPTCRGVGYKGRLGVFELLLITDRIKDMMRENAAVSALRAEARKNGMLYMKEEGLRLVVKGVTSYEELIANVK